jgi:hypothetical protein
MQTEFLHRLSKPVQDFILDVEKRTGININVIPQIKQNEGGTTGQGKLAVNIDTHRIQLFAPTNGYFPDGAVRHEILHVKRFHLDGVPKLVLADTEERDDYFSDALCSLDNAIEHLVIVPIELNFHPERRTHWELVMNDVCLSLPNVPEGELCLVICMHWTFLRHVLPNSPSLEILKKFAQESGLFEVANCFADHFIAILNNKEELVRHLFISFPEISKKRAALEYIISGVESYQKPVP